MANNGSLKSTIAVSLTNYLDAGAIVAGASGLTLWQNYLGLTEVHLGWLNFISANCLGAAIGAIIGGFLADKYGRKFIFTYNLLVYMTGVLLIMFSMNFPMLLAGFLVTGISVGVRGRTSLSRLKSTIAVVTSVFLRCHGASDPCASFCLACSLPLVATSSDG